MVKKDKLIIITKEGLSNLIAFIFFLIIVIGIGFGIVTIKYSSEKIYSVFCTEKYNTSKYDYEYRQIGYSVENKQPIYKIKCGEEVLQRWYIVNTICGERDSFGYCYDDNKILVSFEGEYKLIEGYD